MPHSNYWPFAANFEGDEDSSLLQKQLGLIEGEVKEIQIELAAIRKNRMDLNVKNEITCAVEPEQDDKAKVVLQDNVAEHQDGPSEAVWRRLLHEEWPAPRSPAPLVGMLADRLKSTAKEEVDLIDLKRKVMELLNEIEEMKISITEKNELLEEYRAKYLQAQQRAEELQRQLDLIELENRQVSDEIKEDLQKMRAQFATKLQELAPLPELVADERKQMRTLRSQLRAAEQTAAAHAADAHLAHTKLVEAVTSLNQERARSFRQADELQSMQHLLVEQRAENEQLTASLEEYKCTVRRLETRLGAETVERARVADELQALRAEAPRALARARQRARDERAALRATVAELERQLTVARGHASACQRDRDEARQRMHGQLARLQECYAAAHARLHALHLQVDGFKLTYEQFLAHQDDSVPSNDEL